MSYTLVVVDMQPEFEAANDQYTINKVMALVNKAKTDNADIVILEYGGYDHNKTHQKILDLVKDYDKLAVRKKYSDGGEKEIISVVDELQISTKFKVCGVNWSFCVKSTCIGLIECGYFEVEVYEDACNQPDNFEDDHWYNWKKTKNRMSARGVKVNGKMIKCFEYTEI